jgi:hypothetical protein
VGVFTNETWEDCGEIPITLSNFGIDRMGCYLGVMANGFIQSLTGFKDSLVKSIEDIPQTVYNFIESKFNGFLDSIGLTEGVRAGIIEIGLFIINFLVALIFGLIGIIIVLIMLYPVLTFLLSIFLQMLFIIMAFSSKHKKPFDQLLYFFELNFKWFYFWFITVTLGIINFAYKQVKYLLALLRGAGTTGT